MDFGLHNIDGLAMLKQLDDNSVDLVLTDPPYIISKESGMNKVFNGAKSKYGKKYAIQTDYGKWDAEFTLEKLEEFITEFHRVLKKGGSCVIFFDLWKLETLSEQLLKAKFTKLRFIEWVKTNPVPINSKATYLNNAREVAISCVKGAGQTFNSEYDNGIYKFPIYQGKSGVDRIHPTQKSLPLFEEIIKKHSKEGAIVIDPFGGSGTTYLAADRTGRKSYVAEIDKTYYKKTLTRIAWHEKNKPTKTDSVFFEVK